MGLTCELTPMELFFCTRVMKAKYLDYDYFKRMPDVQKQYSLHEMETLEQLDDEGIVELDFDGNVTVVPEYETLLQPVFFGEKESRLDAAHKPSRRFHLHKERIVMSLIGEEKITFTEVTHKELASFLDEDQVEIHLSDVKCGKKTGVFTAADLKKTENKNLAVSLLKGDA